MYGTLALSHRALDDLADVTGQDAIDELRKLARPIEGAHLRSLTHTDLYYGALGASCLYAQVNVNNTSEFLLMIRGSFCICRLFFFSFAAADTFLTVVQ